MRRIALAVVTALAALSFATPAGAEPSHEPWGTLCAITALADPQVEGSRTGEIHAGPVFVGHGVYAEVTCTVQTGINSTHYEADAAVAWGAGVDVVTVADTVTFEKGENEDVYVCTEVRYPYTRVLYYDDVNGAWTSDRGTGCALAISADTPDPGPIGGEIKPLGCPLLRWLFPPEGDVVLPVAGKIWDCPPDEGSYEIEQHEVLLASPPFVAPPPEALDPGSIDPGPLPSLPVACGDGVDNDGDGRTDYPDDPDCADGLDTNESATPPPPVGCPTIAGVTYCASLTPTTEYQRFAVGGTSSGAVRGYVDAYDFTLPNGAVVTMPCVVLNGASTGADACALAGGRFASRTMTLVDTGTGGSPLASVRVCNADLVLTVNGFGLTRFPAYALC